jgi:condensin subunit ScpA
VTDKFLARLDRADLRTSGRALFYASVLLRMKSDALLEENDPEPESEAEPEPWEVELGREPGPAPVRDDPESVGGDPIEGLEQEMERRLDRKRARGTPETLDELVRELREAERTTYKESREYDTDPGDYRRGTQTLDYRVDDTDRAAGEPDEAAVTGTAHGEDVEDAVDTVQAAVEERFATGREEVLFAEITDVAGSRVETYLGVLFLAHRGGVELEQDDLFGDLWLGRVED